jgi:hypothetical protein
MGLVNESPVWDDEGLAALTDEPITSEYAALDWDTTVSPLVALPVAIG